MRLTMVALILVSAGVVGCEEEPPCEEADDCSDSEVCVAGDCVGALGQEYLLSSASAVDIPQSHPDGSGLWDDPPTPPDPFLEIEDGSGWSCTTFHDDDTLEPSWPDITCPPIVIDSTVSFTWSLYDDDPRDTSELIASLPEGESIQVSAGSLHEGTFTSTADDVTVRLNFTPAQPTE